MASRASFRTDTRIGLDYCSKYEYPSSVLESLPTFPVTNVVLEVSSHVRSLLKLKSMLLISRLEAGIRCYLLSVVIRGHISSENESRYAQVDAAAGRRCYLIPMCDD